ncbi:MAG TPA: aminomethyl-transferring glycine dehydrogenase subunit GcvPA [Coxiellaceae bacterium]|nr:aminomethyl-transferring glycine dehydrogenase subunit GcvPA [Coxiellaceae bacterium]
MAFIPHTEADIDAMLKEMDITAVDTLFDEIPSTIPKAVYNHVCHSAPELAVTQLMKQRAEQQPSLNSYLGAGAYHHFIPACVWELTSRGEFLTSYTPYQAEASQGTLQLIYEYQTMMASLMGMEISNASLYDGATALAEAVLMVVRIKKSKQKTILVPKTINPFYREVLQTVIAHQEITIKEFELELKAENFSDVAALIIPQPDFLGRLNDVDALTNWAHAHQILVIALVNPMAMALLKEPGAWGDTGADIVCGEGQPFGIPVSSGGPYFGFMCCRKEHVRQLPGRLVGKTEDRDGKMGFTLTLQAREQHIRRAKANSNICTNQGLMVTAATIYMSVMGATGLKRIAEHSHHLARQLFHTLSTVEGIEPIFKTPFFHEFVIRVPNSQEFLRAMAKRGIQAGFDLMPYYPELTNGILVCVTELKTREDLKYYCEQARLCLQENYKAETV